MTDNTSHAPAAPDTEPFHRFGELLERARGSAEIREPTAMSLATADERGRPSVRIVLLKAFDERGFVFYTNLGSRKGRELAANPFAALCFHWQPFEVQVRVEGAVQAVDAAEADEYFASRARGSQVGAWASRQSTELPARVDLDQRIAFVEARFGDGAIPRPEFWSGFRVVPERIEFWQGRPSRLHERDVYTRDPAVPGTWRTGQLYP